MNERIKELAEQSGLQQRIWNSLGKELPMWQEDPDNPGLAKFAELIVRECMSLCEDVKFQHNRYRMEETDFSMKNIYAEGEATCDLLQHKMKEHFGIEQ